jgi:DNA mismatch repair protein MutS2
MDAKTLHTLEYQKVLQILAGYASFSASAEIALKLEPANEIADARRRQQLTSEARRLLENNRDVTIGGARDIRAAVDLARRGGVLEAADLIQVKATLIAGRDLFRTISRLDRPFPLITEIAQSLPPPAGIIDSISRSIGDNGEILDDASENLADIRRKIKSAHSRLMSYLEKLIQNPHIQPMLQEPIITQRSGRYVIPLRSDFKGRIRSIIHDQSSSGATLFIEPLPAVDLNNQWHEQQLSERDEVRRILAGISANVGGAADQIKAQVEALARIDFTFMCARYAEDMKASEPILQEKDSLRTDRPGTVIRLYQARHPLLDQQKVVPVDVELEAQAYAVIITGPNTGGKTVTLKTVGLLALMAQSGLQILARSGSEISVFQDIFADIGDEQSIEQSLSTFSGHITNIVRILKKINSQSLVLFDELGSGTDPLEGAALASAILEYLLQQRVTCLIATHYAELKAFANDSKGAINASMEFDVRTLRPTYHLTIGLPGRSNALLIAKRLGLPDMILEMAKRGVSSNDRKADNLLDEIRRQREQAARRNAEAEVFRQEAEQLRKNLTDRLDQIEEEKELIHAEARRQVEMELAALHAELGEIRQFTKQSRSADAGSTEKAIKPEEIKTLQEQLEYLQEELQKKPQKRKASHTRTRRPLKTGDRVHVRSLNLDGRIISMGSEDLEIQLGGLRMRASFDDIQRSAEESDIPENLSPPLSGQSLQVSVLHTSPGMELDLRGQRAEDALDILSSHLDAAYLAGLPMVRIVHGKGTGRLREVVRGALRSSPHVLGFESGLDTEGGDGVTMVKLKAE